jgi:hypothetical protein
VTVAPEVQRLNIKNGNFTFLDRTGRTLASFSGVDFRSSLRGALAIRGKAKIAKISLRNRFFLEQLQSPLRYEPDVLELSKISARAGGGEISGYFAMQPEAEDSPFTTRVTLTMCWLIRLSRRRVVGKEWCKANWRGVSRRLEKLPTRMR